MSQRGKRPSKCFLRQSRGPRSCTAYILARSRSAFYQPSHFPTSNSISLNLEMLPFADSRASVDRVSLVDLSICVVTGQVELDPDPDQVRSDKVRPCQKEGREGKGRFEIRGRTANTATSSSPILTSPQGIKIEKSVRGMEKNV
jgi:hypothetical protein